MTTDVTKIVIGGPFGSGKTTFVETAATGSTVSSEYAVSDKTASLKPRTTVALDHSTVVLTLDGRERTVSLFGTPGQERFSFMIPTIATGMSAFALLVDASRLQSRAQLKKVVATFGSLGIEVPFVVAANRWNHAELPARELAHFVGVEESAVVGCDPREQSQCHELLRHLMERVAGATDSESQS